MLIPQRPTESPKPDDENQGRWNAYVLSGSTPEIRRSRLEEAPERIRKGIESHVRTVFAIKKYYKENKNG